MLNLKFTSRMIILFALLLGGCAANQVRGYQNTYRIYNIPQSVADQVMAKFKEYNLINARIIYDNVGRLQLAGSYKNEAEVDLAFTITQSIVGLKSTSPFYPEDVKEKTWEVEASRLLNNYGKAVKQENVSSRKLALIVGISHFADSEHLKPILGEEDALVAAEQARKAGYTVTSLIGASATKARIEQALMAMMQTVDANGRGDDSLFIYISSHGVQPVPDPSAKEGRKMSILAYDSGMSAGKKILDATDYMVNLQRTSVSDTLVKKLAKLPTQITRIVIDTCYSGEMLSGVRDPNREYKLKVNNNQPERASIALSSWSGNEFTSKGIFFSPNTQIKNGAKPIRVNSESLADRKGYAIITATSEGEQSWGPDNKVAEFDSPVVKNKKLRGSFFTQAFFEYLNHFNGQVEPAFDAAMNFTSTKVATDVSTALKRPVKQTPRQYSQLSSEQNNFSN